MAPRVPLQSLRLLARRRAATRKLPRQAAAHMPANAPQGNVRLQLYRGKSGLDQSKGSSYSLLSFISSSDQRVPGCCDRDHHASLAQSHTRAIPKVPKGKSLELLPPPTLRRVPTVPPHASHLYAEWRRTDLEGGHGNSGSRALTAAGR